MILYVDDEKSVPELYQAALRKIPETEVVLIRNADDAFDFVKKEKHRIKLIIIDLILPTTDKYDEDRTAKGMKTGWILYKDMKLLAPDVHYLFLTSLNYDIRMNLISDKTMEGLTFLEKRNTLPQELADVAKRILDPGLASR